MERVTLDLRLMRTAGVTWWVMGGIWRGCEGDDGDSYLGTEDLSFPEQPPIQLLILFENKRSNHAIYSSVR